MFGTLVRPSASVTIAPDSSSSHPSSAASGLGAKLGAKKNPARASAEEIRVELRRGAAVVRVGRIGRWGAYVK